MVSWLLLILKLPKYQILDYSKIKIVYDTIIPNRTLNAYFPHINICKIYIYAGQNCREDDFMHFLSISYRKFASIST